jgi:hypothetical protein
LFGSELGDVDGERHGGTNRKSVGECLLHVYAGAMRLAFASIAFRINRSKPRSGAILPICSMASRAIPTVIILNFVLGWLMVAVQYSSGPRYCDFFDAAGGGGGEG